MDFRKQAAINSIGSIVLMFGQWLISVLIVRMSGYEDAGIFSLAMTVSNVFSFFANYGLRNYQVSDVQGRYTQGQYLLTRTITALLSVIACGVYLLVAGGYSPVERWAILLYLLYSNVNVLSDTLLGALQLRDRLDINGYSNMMRGTLCFLIFVVTYLMAHDLLLSLGAMALATLLLTVFYDWRCFCRVETMNRWNSADCRAAGCLLKVCFALMLSNIFPVITTALPRRSIQKLAGTEQLGYFSSVFTPTVLITTLVPAIIIALVPKMARAWTDKDRPAFTKLIAQNYGIAVGFVILAELAALVAGRPVMRLVFGDSILDYYYLLYWAIAVTGLNVLVYCGNMTLISVDSKRSVAVLSVLGTVTAWALSDSLVRSFGIGGAAGALAAAYLIQVLLQVLLLWWKVYGHWNGRPDRANETA